jgi:hypothetical protein
MLGVPERHGSQKAFATQTIEPQRAGVSVLHIAPSSQLIWCRTVVLILAVLGSAPPASAYTYEQVGVASNFVIHEGNVYFGQSDGSLTTLDLETGGVIARKKDALYPRSLQWTEAGILLVSYRGTALLNPSTLDAIWQIHNRDTSGLAGQRLVMYDGYGLVECRQLATGNVLWSYKLEGALDIMIESGKVLVFRSAVFDGPHCLPAVVLLDLETGKVTLHKTTPTGVHYLKAFFDGQRVYLAAGTYKGVHDPRFTRFDQGRPSARFEKLVVWDLNGEETEVIPAPEGFKDNWLRYGYPFTLGEKVFVRGRVYDRRDAVPPRMSGLGELVPEDLPGDPETAFTRFEVVDGTLTMRPAALFREMQGFTGKREVTISFESGHHRWTGRLPYLPSPGTVFAVGSTADRILLGSNLGHVECIDAQTGRSIWMYVFPTIRHTMSYSSWGMPPYMATAAATYRRENRNPIPESGMVLDGSVEPSRPKVVLDPSPSNPFEELPRYLAIAWSGAVAPPILVGLMALARGRRHWDGRILAGLSLALTVAATACLWSYGRVSLASSVGLRISMLVPLLAAFAYCLICLREKQRISGVLLLLCSAAITVYLFPAFIHL